MSEPPPAGVPTPAIDMRQSTLGLWQWFCLEFRCFREGDAIDSLQLSLAVAGTVMGAQRVATAAGPGRSLLASVQLRDAAAKWPTETQHRSEDSAHLLEDSATGQVVSIGGRRAAMP